MKRKIICLFLSIVLLLSALIIPSYATDADDDLISVGLEWTEMSFSFNEGIWNDTTHAYEDRGWISAEDGGEITVNNNGSVAVRVSFDYVASQGFEDISVCFLAEEQAIFTQDIETNKSVTVSVSPTGEPSETFEDAQMGTVVITVTKIEEVTQ